MTASPISDLNPVLMASGSKLTLVSKGKLPQAFSELVGGVPSMIWLTWQIARGVIGVHVVCGLCHKLWGLLISSNLSKGSLVTLLE